MRPLTIVLTFSLIFLTSCVFAQDATEIVRQSEAKIRGTVSAYSEMKITIVRPTWDRQMAMKSWSKGDHLSLIVMTEPSRDKGTAFLKRNKEVWNWVPSIERQIKLPPSMMSQSWMGTDFSNDDLVRESSAIRDYTHKIIGEETVDGNLCYKIELIPKPDAPVVWSRVVLYIDKTYLIQMRAEQYDEDDDMVNLMDSKGLKEMGGRMIATKMELIPQDEEGHKTIMEILNIEFDIPIEDGFFTTQNMKKVK